MYVLHLAHLADVFFIAHYLFLDISRWTLAKSCRILGFWGFID